MKNDSGNSRKTAGTRQVSSAKPSDREVSDPHPGSVSDGTHPEANETKLPRNEGDRKHGTPN